MTNPSKTIFALFLVIYHTTIANAQDATVNSKPSIDVKVDGSEGGQTNRDGISFRGRIYTSATLSFSHHIEKKYRSTRFGLDAPIEYFFWDRIAIGGTLDWTSISFAQDDPLDPSITLTDHAERFGLGPSMTWMFLKINDFNFSIHDAISFFVTSSQFSAENTFQLGGLYMISQDVGIGPSVSQKLFLSNVYDSEQTYLAEISFSLFL